jgi:hypothetical protein
MKLSLVVGIVMFLGASEVLATNVGAGANMSAIQAGVTADGIINFDQAGTLTMDANGTGVSTITVAAGVTGIINFAATANQIVFKDAAGAISLGVASSLTIQGTNASAGFDFATTANGRTLTIISSVADTLDDAVAANRIVLGNTNTLVFGATGNTDGLNAVVCSGGTPTIDVNQNLTIATLSVTAGVDPTIDIAEGLQCTITNQVVLGAASILDVTGANAGAAETLVFTGGLQLNGAAAELQITGDTGNATVITGAVTVNVDGGLIDANESCTITSVGMNAGVGNLTMAVANGKTVTTAVDVNDNTLTLTEDGTVSTVNVDTASGIIEVDESCTITTCDFTAAGTVDVANTKTLTVTNGVDTNTNVVTLNNTGTISKVDIDGAAGGVKLTAASATITSLTHTAAGSIDLDTNACNLTVTNEIDVGAQKLSLIGSGAGAAETLTATVDLNNAASELEITGVDADAPIITEVNVSADGATLDTTGGHERRCGQFNVGTGRQYHDHGG